MRLIGRIGIGRRVNNDSHKANKWIASELITLFVYFYRQRIKQTLHIAFAIFTEVLLDSFDSDTHVLNHVHRTTVRTQVINLLISSGSVIYCVWWTDISMALFSPNSVKYRGHMWIILIEMQFTEQYHCSGKPCIQCKSRLPWIQTQSRDKNYVGLHKSIWEFLCPWTRIHFIFQSQQCLVCAISLRRKCILYNGNL